MKYKIVTLLAIAVLIVIYSSLGNNFNLGKGSLEYIRWEEQCIKEYEESEDLFVYIDVPRKRLYLFKDRELLSSYPIATGAKYTPTPLGIFRVITMGDWGEGFGGRWMGLNVPWGKYGIHGTTRPESIGSAASHGCIRMRSRDAENLYKYIRCGTVVEIYGGPFGAFGRGLRELIPGDRGSDVMEVQRMLQIKGYYKGAIDGHYGLSTERALNRFEADNKLPITNHINKDLYKKIGIILMD